MAKGFPMERIRISIDLYKKEECFMFHVPTSQLQSAKNTSKSKPWYIKMMPPLYAKIRKIPKSHPLELRLYNFSPLDVRPPTLAKSGIVLGLIGLFFSPFLKPGVSQGFIEKGELRLSLHHHHALLTQLVDGVGDGITVGWDVVQSSNG